MSVDVVHIGGMTASVYFDGYQKGITQGEGPWRELIYIIEWESSDAFMDLLMGLSTVQPGPGVGMSYSTPHRYPGNPNLYCMEVSAEPVGAARPAPSQENSEGIIDESLSKLYSSDWAKVRARYMASRIDFAGVQNDTAFGGVAVPWSTDTIRGYVQNYPIPAGILKGADSGEPNDKAFELKVNQEEWTRRRYMQSALSVDLIRSLGGSVNKEPIWGMPKGTMLLQPYDATNGIQTDGSRSGELAMSWLYRPVDWNAKLKKDGTSIAWEIQLDEDGHFPYPYEDHTPLTLA